MKFIFIYILAFCSSFFVKCQTGRDVFSVDFSKKHFVKRFPFELQEGKIFIKVFIEKDSFNFIFDNGAMSILSEKLAKQLAAKNTTAIFLSKDYNNVAAKNKLVEIKELFLGTQDLKLNNVFFVEKNIEWVNERACKNVAGIIGYNIMNKCCWQLDFKNKIITVSNRSLQNASDKAFVTKSDVDRTGMMTINVSYQDTTFPVIVDLGSGMGLTVNEAIFFRNKHHFIEGNGYLSQSFNSKISGKRYIDTSSIVIGNKKFNEVLIDATTEKNILSVGTAFFNNGTVTLDWINKEIYFENALNKTWKEIAILNNFGFSLANINNQLKVVFKWKLPFLESIINTDDVVEKIDGISTTNLTQEIYCEIKKELLEKDSLTLTFSNRKEQKFHKQILLNYLK